VASRQRGLKFSGPSKPRAAPIQVGVTAPHRAHSLGELSDETLGACDALVAWHEMKIDAAFISTLRRSRIIVRAGVDFDHIDRAAAAGAGIPVCNTPDYGTSEVADHANIGLMLALRRGIVSYRQNLIADPVVGFDYTRAPLVRRLRGRVFGVSASDASASLPLSAPRHSV
jgi:lactate dehydrogenase-like 2-hydroxyacid dehydrogenase